MLVDDLAGTGHRLYGLLPNMTYLIGRGGGVHFRADWTDPPTIEQAIRYLLDARDRRREGLSLKPFYAEFLGYRWSSQAAFMAGLEVAGPQAVSLPELPELPGYQEWREVRRLAISRPHRLAVLTTDD